MEFVRFAENICYRFDFKILPMATNIKTGLNFVSAKITSAFVDLGLSGTNVLEVYTTDESGNPISWRPGKLINTLPESAGIVADKGYLINSKIDFENLYFAPPFVSPANFSLEKTNNSITVTILPLWGAESFQINYTSSSGGGSASVGAAAAGSNTTKILPGLNASTAYTVTVTPILQNNVSSPYGATPQTVTTDA